MNDDNKRLERIDIETAHGFLEEAEDVLDQVLRPGYDKLNVNRDYGDLNAAEKGAVIVKYANGNAGIESNFCGEDYDLFDIAGMAEANFWDYEISGPNGIGSLKRVIGKGNMVEVAEDDEESGILDQDINSQEDMSDRTIGETVRSQQNHHS